MDAQSSTEAEYGALASATTYLVWIHNLLAEIYIHLPTQPPILWSDNLGAKALACNPVFKPEQNTFGWMCTLFIVKSLIKSLK